MKNSPSLFSTIDLPPFLDDDLLDDDDEAVAIDVDDVPWDQVDDDDEEDGILFLDPGITSDSSHMWESTWQMPSSTSGLRFR